jgi:[ribosomal protein S5]-alanine N-acetyltransferase
LDDIETARLILRRLPRQAMEAGLSGDLRTVEIHLDATVAADLADDPAVLRFALAQLAADPDYLPWSVRALILKESGEMVGHIRFHSRPDPDYLRPYAEKAVEFGYVVFSAHRRRGYAAEAIDGIIRWAQDEHDIQRFIVTIAPDNVASLRLADRFGFRKIGQHVDEVDGIEGIYLREANR